MSVEKDPPFDEDDGQADWAGTWLVAIVAIIGSVVSLDFIASDSVYDTFSYIAGWWGVRYPEVPAALFGAFGHILLQRDAEPAIGLLPWQWAEWVAVVLLFSAVWHSLQYLGLVDTMGYWPMLILLVAALVAGSLIWPLRPTH